jgi:hypothetical protein
MTIEANSRGWKGEINEDKHYTCHDCGGIFQAERLVLEENGKVCPTCRQHMVNKTLQYIKELLSDSSDNGRKTT